MPTDTFLSRKMQEMRYRPGLRPGPRWGSFRAHRAPPDPLAGLRGPTSKGRRWEFTFIGMGRGDREGEMGGPLTVARSS